MRSIRSTYSLFEIGTLVLIAAFLLVFFTLLRSTIERNYIEAQSQEIRQIDMLIERTIISNMNDFRELSRIADRKSGRRFLQEFSDIYSVTADKHVGGILLTEEGSLLFPGFDIGKSRLNAFLESVDSDSISYSPMFRSMEKGELSIFMATKDRGGWLVGRIGLKKLGNTIREFARITGNTIIITTKDGYILTTTAQSLPFHVPPEKTGGVITIESGDYAYSRMRSTFLDNDIVVLSPLSPVNRMVTDLEIIALIFTGLVMIMMVLKILRQSKLMIKPLGTFSDVISRWGIDESAAPVPQEFLRYREIGDLYRSFEARAALVRRSVDDINASRELLKASEERLRLLLKNSNDIIAVLDRNGDPNYISESSLALIGYTPDELSQMRLVDDLVHPEDRSKAAKPFDRIVESPGMTERFESRCRVKDGGWIHMEAVCTNLLEDPAINGIVINVRDITARKRNEAAIRAVNQELEVANEELSATNEELASTLDELTRSQNELQSNQEILKISLREKETLLKELYHRTKNNMQVITSILGLQASYLKDERITKIFRETSNRINSISLVHQKLYQSQSLSRIDLKDYIEELVHLLIASYGTYREKVATRFDLDSIEVVIDTAVPCGLVLNELITNSLKYAFPDDRVGTLSISLKKNAEGLLVLEYGDDGIGIPEGMDIRNSKTLGMSIIINITERQLQGTLEFGNSGGFTCRLSFNPELYGERI